MMKYLFLIHTYLATLCFDNMSVKVCSQSYNSMLNYENISIFSSMTLFGNTATKTVISSKSDDIFNSTC